MVRCALPGPDRRRTYAGFWLHLGSDLGFLGLWSGALFEIARLSDAVDLSQEILEDCIARGGRTPSNLSKRIVDKYALRICDILAMWPRTELERLDEVRRRKFSPWVSLREFVQQAAPYVDVCEVQSGGFVRVARGSTSALTRFRGKEDEKQVALPLVVYGGFPGTAEQNRLIQVLAEAIACDVFDHTWNNRIHWQDPYYSSPDVSTRPDQPLNAALRE